MIQIILQELKKINLDRSNKLLSIIENNQIEVEDSFYVTTIFESFKKYCIQTELFSNLIMGQFQKRLIETPLSFSRGKNSILFTSSFKQGVDFGGVLFHYITKQPLIIFTVTKESTKYMYNSLIWNEEQKTYIDKMSVNLTKTNLDTFYTTFFEALSQDISNWE